MYKSLKQTIRIRGNVNKLKFAKAIMGVTFEEAVEAEWHMNVLRLCQQQFVESKQEAEDMFNVGTKKIKLDDETFHHY